MKKFILGVIFSFFVFLTLFFLYLASAYIDEKFTEGSAYGFSIGDSKEDVFSDSLGSLSSLSSGGGQVFISVKVDNQSSNLLNTSAGYTVMVQTLLNLEEKPSFYNEDSWEFYFEASYFDSLRLSFCDQKLCEIYRHKKMFELP